MQMMTSRSVKNMSCKKTIKPARSLALTGLLFLALGVPTYASHFLKVTNGGTMRIEALYVSVPDDNEWGDDRLGRQMLLPGQYRLVRLDDRCRYDVQAIYDDGAKREFDNVDTCTTNEITFRR